MRVCLFEDQHLRSLEPLVLDRPVFALTFGTATLADRQADYWDATDLGFWVRPPLASRVREEWPKHAVNDRQWLRAGPLVMVNARWIPPLQRQLSQSRCAAIAEHELAFAWIDASDWTAANGLEEQLRWWLVSLPRVAAGGRMLKGILDLAEGHAGEPAPEAVAGPGAKPPPQKATWRDQGRRSA
jgi:hypothetical protein